jgi:hypothetical protein
MRLRQGAVVAAVLSASLTSCGLLSSHHQDRNDLNSVDRRRVGVEVQNHNWNDITVYLMSGGLPQRLGMVTALGSATFDFSSHRLNTSTGVRLRALPVAGQGFTTESILVLPGQIITWTLENDLDASSFSVY